MKKKALFGIIALIFATISGVTAQAATEVAAPNIPSDYKDITKWPFPHTESCKPAGKEYRSSIYARITNGKKIEYVLTTSLNGTIFRYEYSWNGAQPYVGTVFIRTEHGWIQFNITENFAEQFQEYLNKNGVSDKNYKDACHKIIASSFDKFGSELLKKLYEK